MTIKSKRSHWIAGILVLLLVSGIGCSKRLVEQPTIGTKPIVDRFCAAFGMDKQSLDKTDRMLLHFLVSISEREDINAKDENDWTLLLEAIGWQNVELIKFLVSEGADVNMKGGNGQFTPLHLAVISGNMEIIKFFVSAGADVNAANAHGFTPLHWTTAGHYTNGETYYADIEIAKFLVSVGADIHAKNKDGKTPLDTAKENGHTVAVEYLSSIR